MAKELPSAGRPRQSLPLGVYLGRAYLETGELSKAESRFVLYLGLAPNELEGYDGLAETAFRQGDYEKALRLFGQSLTLYGDQPEIEARLAGIAKKSDDLVGQAQWVLANYVQRGGRTGTADGKGLLATDHGGSYG